MCLWDPCLQVCDTGGIVGARCVPAAAPAASAQNPLWNWQAQLIPVSLLLAMLGVLGAGR